MSLSRHAPSLLLPLAAAGALVFSGCGPAPENTAASPPKTARTNAAAAADTSATNAHPGFQSIFDEGKEAGLDPFFPNSPRRAARMAAGSPSGGPPAPVAKAPALPPSAFIRLTGIRPSRVRPFALINKTVFEPGERGEVVVQVPDAAGKLESQRLSIRCLEIRADSVLISVEGEAGTRELRSPEAQ